MVKSGCTFEPPRRAAAALGVEPCAAAAGGNGEKRKGKTPVERKEEAQDREKKGGRWVVKTRKRVRALRASWSAAAVQ